MNRDDLTQAVSAWLESTTGASEAADWLLDRAEASGQIPKQPTLDVTVPWQDALASFFSAQFIRLSNRGRKFTVYFERWEVEQVGESGVLLPVLAEARGRLLVNRRQDRQQREKHLQDLLIPYRDHEGLTGHVARFELENLNVRQGRFWHRSGRWSSSETERELSRYLRLLQFADGLRKEASRIERVVHVSRVVAGDTHWLRPRNRIWRDLAEDILNFDADLKTRLNELTGSELFGRALADIGIVENFTSIMVLVYGQFALQRRDTIWNWPEEAAQQRLPIWLTALHLKDSRIVPKAMINQVICVENETSFLDLVEQHAADTGIVLVYTQGQANRAVVDLLRLLSESSPTGEFHHQGDLDLPGVRIFASLCERSGLSIQSSKMDAETHRRFTMSGISLTDIEYADVVREVAARRLPCLDLLEEIAATKRRIEQETITADHSF